ncbi:hypothetical protein EN851_01710 [Mesorhizobium sp. M8A.F.Ca.ET.208.01.1.1]|nr:hypothetical protein EN851_01710 [Mesorhizobium sp. M8A.F.Ca.ET.208.01.1.1]TGT54811.1 hypothetical protein EN810_01710 [Mesorhizobium sp. M8A.F.Ca.ET.167.01.1.1]
MAEAIILGLGHCRAMDMGKYGGANQGDRWRKRMRQGRRRRLSRNLIIWLFILATSAISSTLIAMNAHWRF